MKDTRKTTLMIMALAGACLAGSASADIIRYTISGTLRSTAGSNTEGFDGASLTFVTEFDDSVPYSNFFGNAFAVAVDGSAVVSISGATVGANNTSYSTGQQINFFPTFGSILGGNANPEFTSGSGLAVRLATPSALPIASGSANVVDGGMIELDDFFTGTIDFGDLTMFLPVDFTNDNYALDNAFAAAAFVPTPGGLAVLGISGLVATRRRRG